MLKIYYREHDSERFRIWPEGWVGDQFEIVDRVAFKQYREMSEKLGIVTFIDQDAAEVEEETRNPYHGMSQREKDEAHAFQVRRMMADGA
jgi:hypothetical protein